MANVKTRIIVAVALFFCGILLFNVPDDMATPIVLALACVGFVILVVEYACAWRRTLRGNQPMELTGGAGSGRRWATELVYAMRQIFAETRWVALSTIFVWAVLIATSLRSWVQGFSLHITLLITLIFAAPFAVFFGFGLPWKKHLSVVLALISTSAILAEAYALAEEHWFVAQHDHLPPTADVVFHDRWWPNGSSYLYYDPSTGLLGGGD